MMNSDIFKLIFEHDLRLDKLEERNIGKSKGKSEATLTDFMTPDPTYSKFYLSGTDLAAERFGLNMIQGYRQIIDALEEAFSNQKVFTHKGSDSSISFSLESIEIGEVLVLTEQDEIALDIPTLHVDANSNVGHLKTELKKVLEAGHIVIYKEQAKDGFDLHIFSEKNVYENMFYPLQELVPDAFRFFSINGKKFRSERHFYFETWTLDKPPHGFEEVFPESVL